MVSSKMTFRLLAATILLSGVAFAGAAMATPLAETAPASQKMASVVAAPAAAVPSSVVAPVPAAVSEAPAACARKVKVVYAGYGEAARASCIVSSSAAAN